VRGREAEHAADRGEGAAGGGAGEQVGGGGIGQQRLELGGAGGGLGAEGADQPGACGGKGRAAAGAAVVAGAGPRRRQGAGGEAGEQAVEAARGAGEVLPKRDDEGGMKWVVEEAAGDKGGEVAEDDAEAGHAEGWGEVGGGGEWRGVHGLIS
jgi:hypothetical protein